MFFFFILHLPQSSCGMNETHLCYRTIICHSKISKNHEKEKYMWHEWTHLSSLHPRVSTLHWTKLHECSVSTFDIVLHHFNSKLWYQLQIQTWLKPTHMTSFVLYIIYQIYQISNIFDIKFIKDRIYQISNISLDSRSREIGLLFSIFSCLSTFSLYTIQKTSTFFV